MIIDKLARKGHQSAPNCWPPDRDDILMDSAFMLNIHQDDWPVIEPLRLALAAACAMPIITERIYDSYPYNRGGKGHSLIEVEYEDLVQAALGAIKKGPESLRAMGWRAHDLMTTEFGFRRQVEMAVRALECAPIDPLVIK